MTTDQTPQSGVDFPRTFKEFDNFFPDEAACRDYLFRLRWPQGFCCPRCGSRSASWVTARDYIHCRDCQGQVSITGGTVFDRTRNPLRTWFLAIWFVTSQKYGTSALGLQRVLGLGSYRTAWTWLHKLRRAMIRPGRDPLSGDVEVDEAYIGGEEEGVRGRETYKKAIVGIAVEIHFPKGFGRIRIHRLTDVSAASLIPFVCNAVKPGSNVNTDGWSGYTKLAKRGYVHRITNQSASESPAHVLMPAVHRVAALLKRWLLGTHQGAVSNHHLDYYLDEFTFRFNRRSSRSRGLLFYRLVQQAATTAPSPYHSIIGGINAVNHKI